MVTKLILYISVQVTEEFNANMFVTFPPQRSVIVEMPDIFPVELMDAGVCEILDETGNSLLDEEGRVILDENYP
jgi:hypothetical protein